MIKEKHDKQAESVKEEPSGSDKETSTNEVRIKKEDEAASSNCQIKKEPSSNSNRPITKNGGIIGSTNTGSLANERKLENDETSTNVDQVGGLTLKTEECIENDLPNDAFALGLSGGPPHSAPPDGVQPLVSNVISKQPGSMEVQYMQQQSQIFVFSTVLANTGAEEVLQGRYPSIIAYHCAQPGTKKYLEKNPLKVTQFNRQNPAQWLNNLAMMKNKGCMRSPGLGLKNQTTIDNFLNTDGLDDMVLGESDLSWDQKSNHHLEGLDGVGNGLPDVVPDMDACSPSLTNVQPSLQGVKVPDENLTPQQRQHREEQLATIRKMHQMLFPENQALDNPNVPPSTQSASQQSQQPTSQSQTQSQTNSSAIDLPHMPGNQQGVPPPIPNASQLEWLKMHQISDDRKLKSDNRTTNQSSTCQQTSGVPIGPVSSGAGCSMSVRGVVGSGPRLQGPPPPYHQTQRSASVPIALQSPSPSSPNNPTSNLSLPSPRASSALNSPADPNRQFNLGRHVGTGQSPNSQDSPSGQRLNHSNPGTPVSSHLSPSVTTSNTESTSSTHQPSGEGGMFGRTLQSMAQQKQLNNTSTTSCTTTPTSGGKEPNLMPVPSPQQIQYLNTFEGQELIIQKQPNTSLKERNIITPPILPTTLDSGFNNNPTDLAHTRLSGPNTPTSIDVGTRFPPTPGVSAEGCRFQIPSPHTPTTVTTGEKGQRLAGPGPTSAPGLSPQTATGPTSDPLKNDLFPTPSPHMMDVPRFSAPNSSPGTKIGPNFVNVSPSGKPSPLELQNYGCARGDNVPLNPNCTSAMSMNAKVSHFDPISSLAQMSQQLTNSVASSLNGQNQPPGGGMMNFGSPSMHMIEMGACHNMNDLDQTGGPVGMLGMQGGGPPPPPPPPHGFHPNSPIGPIRSLSPKLPGAFPNHMPMPRMMGRPPGPNPYNGANVQVKPNAPNTIQYIPPKSQVGNNPGPRGPPSLDFLQRFANPLSNMDTKIPTQNLQYFPNNGPMQPGMPPQHMTHCEAGMPNDGTMMMGGPMGNGSGPMMGNSMGMPAGMIPMMRGAPMRGTPGLMRMPQMGFNGPAPNAPDPMFNPNAQMFVSGPKGSPMGMGAPDASQPLPPSMGQNNTFKNSPFVGPTTADPNYAQQFHNFQQQLYATGTRSQMGGQAMGPGPGPPHNQQPPYFNPK